MTGWWSFDTHIYTQFFTVLFVTAVHWLAVRLQPPALHALWSITAVLGLLASLVFLGHFGFFINTGLLLGLLFGIVWLLAWRGHGWARRVRWPLSVLLVGTSLVALIFFYSAYLWLFLEQATAVAEGGLTGLAERAPVSRERLWQVLWQAGLIIHFGFFPLLLAFPGLALLLQRRGPARITAVLIGLSFGISSAFAILPFVTLSTQSTRWLMFSAWAIAVASSLAVLHLWRSGRYGRIVVLAMGGFVLWNTAFYWLAPLAWRIRPPEPF